MPIELFRIEETRGWMPRQRNSVLPGTNFLCRENQQKTIEESAVLCLELPICL